MSAKAEKPRFAASRSMKVWPRNERVELANADYDGVHLEGGKTTLRKIAASWNVPLNTLKNYRANHLRRSPVNAELSGVAARSNP